MQIDYSYMIGRIFFIAKYIPLTMLMAVISMTIGTLLGTVIGVVRFNKYRLLDRLLGVYVSFFRGTPLIVQIFLFYFGLPQLFPITSNIDALTMSIIVMSINASAYISETIRGSISAVDKDQMEAALSIGMTKLLAMRRIILPQAFRIALPPLGNTFISLIQGTAITFTVGVSEMMGIAKIGAASSYKFFETFLAVGILYWIITFLSSYLLKMLERRFRLSY